MLHPALDIVGIEDWRRKAGVLDPTEENITYAWQYGISWDWRPDPPDMLQVYREFFEWVKKPVIVNFGTGSGDGNCWAPYASGYKPNVQDQEEDALFYKVYFDMIQNLSLYGVAMEHYSFIPSNTTITGCFRGTIAEGFIKAGLDAHSRNFSSVTGKLKDRNENPLKASIYAFKKDSDVIADNYRTDENGTYRIEVTPGFYDVRYNLTDFFIKLLSVNVNNDISNPIKEITKEENKLSILLESNYSKKIEIYSLKKPVRVKINGTEVPSWSYDEDKKLIKINVTSVH